MNGATRREHDSLGEVEVPADALYGAQTARAVEAFQISGWTAPQPLIRSYLLIKKAAAAANADLGQIDPEVAGAIAKAADEALAGKWRDQFPVDVFQMGAGTSFHMNINEVLANRANEILGGERGKYDRVHPNDHVNRGQSTNDTYPTAMRMAGRFAMGDLLEVLTDLENAFQDRAAAFDSILKSGRTHLQDAVPIRLGQEFAAYAAAIERARGEVAAAAGGLEELGIGGSAAGTGLNTAAGYRSKVINHLSLWTGIAWRLAPDLREAMQSQYPVARASGSLRLLSNELIRIANDLRLLSSGPMTGLAEITLPAISPGSSIMPGKINPSLAEMLNMVCFQVIGNDTAIGLAVQAGQLELNVMMPVMAFNLVRSSELLTNACRVFTDRCVRGITANEERCRRYAESSPAIATALTPQIGYEEAAKLVQRALVEGRTVTEVAREEGALSEDEIARLLDPRAMTEPPAE
ncbi:MAG TPA: aspartate ammonia-lyase [Armatimonadota bacterium]|nr:aspartate ammonia-lyase [Armatimonadota bacterium]